MARDLFARGGRRAAILTWLAVAALAAPLAACSNVTDPLLEAEDPDPIDPGDLVTTPEAAVALYTGALDRFRNITAGTESTWLFGGLLADEWSTSSTFVQNDETDQREIQINNSSITPMFRELNRVRTATNQAIWALNKFTPDDVVRIAEMYFARGFAEMQLAQDFCSSIPLSQPSSPDDPVGGGYQPQFSAPLSTAEVFERAVASYDSALTTLGTSTAAAAVNVRRAAQIGKARALLGMGQIEAAGELMTAAQIPTSYAYSHTFAVTSGSNILWSQPASQRRYTVGDSLEGNARDLEVLNAIPFFSAKDPRLPVSYRVTNAGRDTTRSQDGQTFSRTTTLWARTTAVPVVSGLDARLIEAEAALAAGDAAEMLSILNALRAAPPKLGEVQPAVLPALDDPGTTAGRVNLLFRERAFWTFSRGQRLGDLRRLIRQYGRTPDETFPVGPHYRGGTYGTDVNLPVPQQEENNPEFERNGGRAACKQNEA